MKLVFASFLVMCFGIWISTSFDPNDDDDSEYVSNRWKAFKENFKRKFSTDSEDKRRRGIFAACLRKIVRHNKRFDQGLETYKMAINRFSDMDESEKMKFNGLKTSGKRRLTTTSNVTTPRRNSIVSNQTATVDWRIKGYVSPVKDQGPCGSCWAFSAVDSLESRYYEKNKTKQILSEQNLVDCVDWGCDGSNMDEAFSYVDSNGGIDTAASYPYEAQTRPCRYTAANRGATIQGYVAVPADEDVIRDAVASGGPVSVGMDASCSSFFSYSSGIYDDPNCSSSDLNHAVLIVGYGSVNGTDYWILKNSWSSTWGDKGYFLMRRGINAYGIATMASYPLM